MLISQYEALLKAVESGTMTQAARELGYTQSGLTRAIDAVEKEWGVRVLNRSRTGVQLTAEGELLLPYIRMLLHDQQRLREQIDQIKGLKEGLIRVGTFNSVSAQWLPGMIAKFHADFPGVRFELQHGTDEQIVSWIEDGKVDLGFVAYPTKPELDALFLYRDPIVGIFAEDDPHAALPSFAVSQLTGLPYIALNEGVEDEITAILNQNRIKPNAIFVESDDHAVIAMVEQGLGTSLMSEMMLRGFERRIKAVPLEPAGWRDLGVACRDRRLLSAAAKKFTEYIRAWIREDWNAQNETQNEILKETPRENQVKSV